MSAPIVSAPRARQSRDASCALPLIAVGVVAILIGLILQSPTRSAICAPMLLVAMLAFSVGFGLFFVGRRSQKMLGRAATGLPLSENELIYVFHNEMRDLAIKHGRNTAITSSTYQSARPIEQ